MENFCSEMGEDFWVALHIIAGSLLCPHRIFNENNNHNFNCISLMLRISLQKTINDYVMVNIINIIINFSLSLSLCLCLSLSLSLSPYFLLYFSLSLPLS